MDIETVAIDSLTQDPKNARVHPEENLESIRASLERFGQRIPLVVRDGVVVAGNGRLAAMEQLGWTEVQVTRADDLSYEEAQAFAIVDNRTGELAEWNDEQLMANLKEVSGFDGLEKMLQFDIKKLEDAAKTTTVRTHTRDVGGNGKNPGPDPTENAEPGDTWILGDHELKCGEIGVDQCDDLVRLWQKLSGQKARRIPAKPLE